MTSEPLAQSAVETTTSWLRKNRTRLLKFAGVGVTGTFINLAISMAAYHYVLVALPTDDLQFVAANGAGFIISVFTNFLLNDWWTWGDRRKGGTRHWFQRLGKYYATASGAGAVQLFSAWLSLRLLWAPMAPTLDGIKLAPPLGVLTGIGCGMVINFAFCHLWAFRDAPTPRKH